MVRTLIWALAAVYLPGSLYGQGYTVCGTVKTEEAQPLGFVTIQVDGGEERVFGSLSDSLGAFCITVPAGFYTMTIKTWGFESYTTDINVDQNIQLAGIVMYLDDSTKGAEITASRPIVTHEIDRMRVSVENTMLGSGDMWDMLRLAPGILADAHGNLLIHGKSGIKVMIDGRPLNLSGADLQGFLAGLSAQDVSSIEILSNPPASMDASGAGVINIVMKKAKQNGYSVNLRQQFTRGINNKYKTGLGGMYRRGKVFVNGSYDFGQTKDFIQEQNSIRFFEDALDFVDWEEQIERTKRVQNHGYHVFVDCEISPKSSLSFRSAGRINPWTYTSTHATTRIGGDVNQPDSSIVNQSDLSLKSNYLDGYLGYSRKIGKANFSADFDYTNFGKNQDQAVNSRYLGYDGAEMRSDSFLQEAFQEVDLYGARVDMSQPVSEKVMVEYGVKYSHISTRNVSERSNIRQGVATTDSFLSNAFDYKERNAATYFSMKGKLKKIEFQTGLRAEYTDLEGSSRNEGRLLDLQYVRLFPSLALKVSGEKESSYGFLYSQRINRPNYRLLNAFRVYTSPYNYFEGNPFLLPSITRRAEVNWLWKYKYYFALFGELVSKPIEEISIQDNASQTLRYTAINLDQAVRAGVAINGTAELNNWWTIYWDFSGYYQRYQFLTPYTGEPVENAAFVFSPFVWNGFRIGALGDLSLEWEFSYNSPIYQGAFRIDRRSQLALGASKSFLKSRMKLTLFYADVLNQNLFTLRTDFGLQQHVFRENPENQYLRIGLAWKFGSEKEGKSEKKINTEEKQRL